MKRQHTVEYFINGCRVKAMRVDTAAEAEALVGGANGLCAEALSRMDETIVTPTTACSPESSRANPPLPPLQGISPASIPQTDVCIPCTACWKWILSSRQDQHMRACHPDIWAMCNPDLSEDLYGSEEE